jgi:predicted MFS family arabinose efflux permease
MGGLIVALLAGAMAPGFAWLAACSVLIGLFSAVTQQLVPFAVHLASPSQHGRVLGVMTGGILTGILLARAAAGIVADLWGWRMVYWGAAGLTLATVVMLAVRLPRLAPAVNLGYFRLLQSMGTLLRSYRPLRVAITVQALLFSAFMAFWANLAIVFQEPSYRLGPTAIGLMAVVGAGGVLAAPLAGNFADRKGPAAVVSAGAAVVVLAFVLLGLFQGSLAVMIVGALLMDVAVYAAHVANWARVHALEPTAHSRLNTIFIATMILGGACGAGAGGLAYSWWGWSGTCGYAAIAAGIAFIVSRGFPDRKPNEAR